MPLNEPKDGEEFDQKYVGDLIDPEDQENYANGKVSIKTLQPVEKYLHVFDMEHLLKEWKVNNINDRSFRCTDPAFFDDNADFWQKNQKLGESDQPNQGIRHGVYAQSSKDWEKIKPMMIEETNKMREEKLNKQKELEKAMTKDELD